MADLDAAIEAAARALRGGGWTQLIPGAARTAVTAAAPRIRAQVAEEIAAAIEAVDPVEWALAGQHAGFAAAAIARQHATPTSEESHLARCGCLRNDADAHRVGCPEYPEGRRG